MSITIKSIKTITKEIRRKILPRQYDRIVSIGSNCEVTWNIRNYFNTDKAYPFDWWMTPFQSTIDILDTRFNGLFEAANIDIPADRGTVVDKRFNLMYHHDFARDEDNLIVPDKIEEQLVTLRHKYQYLAARFIDDLDGKEVLFVRNRCGNDPAYLRGDYGDIQPDQCIELHRALTKLLPNCRFDLFATNKPGFEAFRHRDSRIFSDSIVEHGDCDDYMVSPKGWAEMFRRNDVRLRTR